jgi:hypothetical protein
MHCFNLSPPIHAIFIHQTNKNRKRACLIFFYDCYFFITVSDRVAALWSLWSVCKISFLSLHFFLQILLMPVLKIKDVFIIKIKKMKTKFSFPFLVCGFCDWIVLTTMLNCLLYLDSDWSCLALDYLPKPPPNTQYPGLASMFCPSRQLTSGFFFMRGHLF